MKSFGFTAKVRLRSGADIVEWPARFARISDMVDPKTRTIGAIVAVDGAYAQATPGSRPPLTKGMFVEIEIQTRPQEAMIVVPRAALHNGSVYVVNGKNRLEVRPVTVGLLQGDLAVIDKGIEPGTRVIVSDLIPAISGMLLTPEPDKDVLARLKSGAAGGGTTSGGTARQ
jgi:multidrug efflux system membrane fusion protein